MSAKKTPPTKSSKKPAPPKKAPAKKAAKAKPTAAEEKARSLARTTGEGLETLLKGHTPLVAIAKALAAGKATHAQLVTLRDGINEIAGALRQEDKPAEAKKLSDVNRLVRRLERAARKENL